MNPMSATPATPALPSPMRRRPVRSATYHRLATASRDMASAGHGRPTVLPTRSSLLRRALRTLGCAV